MDWLNSWRKPATPTLPKAALDLPDDELAEAAFKLAAASLDKAAGPYLSKIHLLSPPWRRVYALFMLDAEVNNGGFHQFFSNTQGFFDPHLEEDIARLEHSGYREVLQAAFEVYSSFDYASQWDNLGKSWEEFAQGYEDGRFTAVELELSDLSPSLNEVIGAHVLAHSIVYVV